MKSRDARLGLLARLLHDRRRGYHQDHWNPVESGTWWRIGWCFKIQNETMRW